MNGLEIAMDTDVEIARLISIQNDIAERKYELNQLVQDEKTQRDKIGIAVQKKLLTMTIGDGRDWLNVMYWKDSDLAAPVRNAFKNVFGGVFHAEPLDKEVQCRRGCGVEGIVLCKSWADYKQNSWTCENCLAKENLERQNSPQVRLQQQFQQEQEQKQSAVTALRKLPYKEYLLTEHWQEFRKHALKRAKYRCQLCNKSGKLDIHHRTYENLGCEHVSDVIALCRECHEKHHDIQKPEAKIVKFSDKGYGDIEDAPEQLPESLQ